MRFSKIVGVHNLVPYTGCVIKVGSINTPEVMHAGYVNVNTNFQRLARQFAAGSAGPPYVGSQIFWGHDYETNPSPPPATILARKHETIQVKFPGITILHWCACSGQVATLVTAPVGYVPKGAKCGVFMPIILRFLSLRRRRANPR